MATPHSALRTPHSPVARETARRLTRRRLWAFRIAAVLLGLSVFVATEAACTVFDWGQPSDYDDPFVGFSAIHPLFVRSADGNEYEIAPSRLKFFARDSFPAEKSPNAFRIFCLGGSTVQGRPFSIETSFTTWLALSLEAADPSREWQVVNCGGISYATYRLTPILEECLAYQPDLFIICEGHNEFLEERTYDHVKHPAAVLDVPLRAAGRLRTFTLLRHAAFSAAGVPVGPGKKPQMKAEVDALLDYKNGLKAFTRNDAWRAGVVEHFEHNLRRMTAIANRAGVPVIFVQPSSNLCDCPPFKSEHREGLSKDDEARWAKLVQDAKAHYRDDLQSSVRLLREALDVDDRHAAAWYELGKCYEALGLSVQAREAFIRARDEDICPLRMLSSMETAMARVARGTGTPFLDAHHLLEQRCPNGILGNFLLVDHIHPSFEGHQLIANALTEEMAKGRLVAVAPDWIADRDSAYRKHFASLGDFYFLNGLRDLEMVRGWTQGRADGPPIEERLRERGGGR